MAAEISPQKQGDRKTRQFRLYVCIGAALAIVADIIIAHFTWTWYSNVQAQPEPNRDAMIAVAGIAAVVWTGGLVAFSIYRKFSAGLAVALGMVQLAFMAPLVGLIAQGAVLRTITFLAALGYGAWASLGLRFYLAVRKGTLSVTVAPVDEKLKDDPEFLALASERKDEIEGLLARIQAFRYYFVPAACMLTIFWFGTATSVTWSSVVLLFVGLVSTHMALFYPPSAHRQITVTRKST